MYPWLKLCSAELEGIELSNMVEVIKGKFAFTWLLDAGDHLHLLFSSLGGFCVDHFNDDNVDDEAVDCPVSAENPSESTCALTRLPERYNQV